MSDKWKGKNVLITGISGFVGGAVSEHLINEGANVTGIINDVGTLDRLGSLPGAHIFAGDICDYQFLAKVISSQEIDVIFHFAAYAIVRISARDPLTTYNVNVMGTVNLLEAARNIGRCKKIIVASSDKAYGDHEILPYTEKHALQPLNTYDTSKACMDMIARSYAHNYNLPIVVTRSSNIYGPGDGNKSRIVPNSIIKALNGESPVLYEDVEKMERELIYIGDVVDAYDLLGTSGDETNGKSYNIGGTGPVKIGDVVQKIIELVGNNVIPTIVKRENGFQEILRQYIDASLLTKATGWTPRVSLEHGLKETISWYERIEG